MVNKTSVIRVPKELAEYYKKMKKRERNNLKRKFKNKLKRLMNVKKKR